VLELVVAAILKTKTEALINNVVLFCWIILINCFTFLLQMNGKMFKRKHSQNG